MKTIAERLKEARELKGWTQAQLAIAADVSTGTIGNIESGARQSKGSVPQIAKALGISYEWLANESGPRIIPTGAAHGSLAFAGQVTGEHVQNQHLSHADINGVATNFVAEKPLGVYAMAVGRPGKKQRTQQTTIRRFFYTYIITNDRVVRTRCKINSHIRVYILTFVIH